MKNHKWIAALAVIVMALAVAGWSNPSSGNKSTTGSSGGSGNSSGTGNSGVDYSKCVVGDFLLKDGTILSKDETPKRGTVAAVIVRAAADGKPALGVGMVHKQKAWCTESATGYSTNITSLQGDETTGYTDGRDGWKKLKEACSDAESNPENYPAWNYCRNYGAKNGLEGDLATGWYLPTMAELYTIYKNKNAVDASLSKAGGSQFGGTSWYRSCCQDPSYVDDASVMDFYTGNMGCYI